MLFRYESAVPGIRDGFGQWQPGEVKDVTDEAEIEALKNAPGTFSQPDAGTAVGVPAQPYEPWPESNTPSQGPPAFVTPSQDTGDASEPGSAEAE